MAIEYSQAELDRQLNHPEESSTESLAELIIIRMCTVELAIVLHMLARKLEKKPFRMDDFILVVCAVSFKNCTTFEANIWCGSDDLLLKFTNVLWVLTVITFWLLEILVIGYASTGRMDLRHGYGHHTLTITKEDFHSRAQARIPTQLRLCKGTVPILKDHVSRTSPGNSARNTTPFAYSRHLVQC